MIITLQWRAMECFYSRWVIKIAFSPFLTTHVLNKFHVIFPAFAFEFKRPSRTQNSHSFLPSQFTRTSNAPFFSLDLISKCNLFSPFFSTLPARTTGDSRRQLNDVGHTKSQIRAGSCSPWQHRCRWKIIDWSRRLSDTQKLSRVQHEVEKSSQWDGKTLKILLTF